MKVFFPLLNKLLISTNRILESLIICIFVEVKITAYGFGI